jgi:hypothetical protein
MEQHPGTTEQLKCLLDRWLDDDPKSGRRGLSGAVTSAGSSEEGPVAGFPAVSGNPI